MHVLGDQPLRNGNAAALVRPHDAGKVVPSTGRDELLAIKRRLNVVEIVLFNVKIRRDGRMHARSQGICLPCAVIWVDVYPLQAIPRRNVKIMRAAIEFRRIAGSDNHPAFGNRMTTEYLVLKELQNRGRKCFGDAVNFVQK